MDTQVVIANEGATLVTHSIAFPPEKCSWKYLKTQQSFLKIFV